MGVIEELVGTPPSSALAAALAKRADILALSQASHDAVLLPKDPGGLSHGLRAALAARMARQNAHGPLASHYEALLLRSGEKDGSSVEPAEQARIAAIVAHCDLLTLRPRDAGRGDIDRLKGAGIGDADIVRIAELAAFVNYQVRVIRGLQMLGAAV